MDSMPVGNQGFKPQAGDFCDILHCNLRCYGDVVIDLSDFH